MRQLLVATLYVRYDIPWIVGGIQRMYAQQAERPEGKAEHSANGRKDSNLDEVLYEDLPAACSESAAHACDRCGIEEFGQQYANRVEQAHCKERECDTDEHAIVVLDHALVFQPLADVREAIVPRAGEASGLALLGPVPVQQRLHALSTRAARQLDPHLGPDAVGAEIFLKRVDRFGCPAVRASTVRIFGERARPTECDEHIIGYAEGPIVQIIEAGNGCPGVHHTYIPELVVVPTDRPADTVGSA